MTAEDKSKDMYVKMLEGIPDDVELMTAIIIAKRNAIIAFDEIINELKSVDFNYDLESRNKDTCLSNTVIPYYEEVKSHLLKM